MFYLLCTNNTIFHQDQLGSFGDETWFNRWTDRQYFYDVLILCTHINGMYKRKAYFQQHIKSNYGCHKEVHIFFNRNGVWFNLVTNFFCHSWITIHPLWPQPKHTICCACCNLECGRIQRLHAGEVIFHWEDPCWPCHWFYQLRNICLLESISAHNNHCCPQYHLCHLRVETQFVKLNIYDRLI